MIDFHSHILPALDDGALSVDDSLAMAKALAAFGYKTVCCTPHCIKGFYDLSPQRVREATLMLQADLDNADIKLQLWPGMEYMLDEGFAEYADDLLPLGDTRLVLCEAPSRVHPGCVPEGLELIIDKGFVPLVAHPERTQYFYEMLRSQDAERRTRNAENLKENQVGSFETGEVKPKGFFNKIFSSLVPRPASRGPVLTPHTTRHALPEVCMFHANLGSFTGYYGAEVQRRAYDLLKLGVYTAMASDLHDSSSAPQVLVYDKFAMNPILKKLAEFDGVAPQMQPAGKHQEGEQGSLF